MRPTVPVVLSFTGGYVDTAGFLALQGLFAAHVTGNFVTLGAAIAHGSSGIIAKLLALPVFCAAIVLLRCVTVPLPMSPQRSLLLMLIAQFLFLAGGAAYAMSSGSFADPDGLPLIVTGMLLVIAMAIQNAAHRIHLSATPPSTLMTGTTTQIMIDAADLLRGVPAETRPSISMRLGRLIVAVVAFVLGCGFAALLYILSGMWCFLVPPMLVLAAIVALVWESGGTQQAS